MRAMIALMLLAILLTGSATAADPVAEGQADVAVWPLRVRTQPLQSITKPLAECLQQAVPALAGMENAEVEMLSLLMPALGLPADLIDTRRGIEILVHDPLAPSKRYAVLLPVREGADLPARLREAGLQVTELKDGMYRTEQEERTCFLTTAGASVVLCASDEATARQLREHIPQQPAEEKGLPEAPIEITLDLATIPNEDFQRLLRAAGRNEPAPTIDAAELTEPMISGRLFDVVLRMGARITQQLESLTLRITPKSSHLQASLLVIPKPETTLAKYLELAQEHSAPEDDYLRAFPDALSLTRTDLTPELVALLAPHLEASVSEVQTATGSSDAEFRARLVKLFGRFRGRYAAVDLPQPGGLDAATVLLIEVDDPAAFRADLLALMPGFCRYLDNLMQALGMDGMRLTAAPEAGIPGPAGSTYDRLGLQGTFTDKEGDIVDPEDALALALVEVAIEQGLNDELRVAVGQHGSLVVLVNSRDADDRLQQILQAVAQPSEGQPLFPPDEFPHRQIGRDAFWLNRMIGQKLSQPEDQPGGLPEETRDALAKTVDRDAPPVRITQGVEQLNGRLVLRMDADVPALGVRYLSGMMTILTAPASGVPSPQRNVPAESFESGAAPGSGSVTWNESSTQPTATVRLLAQPDTTDLQAFDEIRRHLGVKDWGDRRKALLSIAANRLGVLNRLPEWVELTEGLSDPDDDRRERVFRSFASGTAVQQVLLWRVVNNPGAPPKRMLTINCSQVQPGDKVSFRYGFRLDDAMPFAWVQDTTTNPISVSTRVLRNPIRVYHAEMIGVGSEGGHGGGGRFGYRNSSGRIHPIRSLRLIRAADPQHSGTGHITAGSYGTIELHWNRFAAVSKDLEPTEMPIGLNEAWTLQAAELPASPGAVIPVLPDPELLGKVRSGLRLIVSPKQPQYTTTLRQVASGSQDVLATFALRLELVGDQPCKVYDVGAFPYRVLWSIVLDEHGSFVDMASPHLPISDINTWENEDFVLLEPGGEEHIDVSYFFPRPLREGSYRIIVGFGPFVASETSTPPPHYFTGELLSSPIDFHLRKADVPE